MIPLLFSYLSAVSGILSLVLGIYTWRQNPSARLNKIHLLLSLSLFLWAFPYSFVYSAQTKEAAWLWYKISGLGWCTFMGVGMLFLLELSGHRPLPSLLLYPLAYLPPALFLYRLFFKTLLVKDFTLGPLGWIEVKAEDTIWLIIFWAHTISSLSLGFFSLIKKARSSSLRRERLRTTFIIKAGILTTILGLITNMLLPLIGRGPVP
ncbi:MAG: histidine kinase N-terminal 7TM domain-containing protein, partial [Desulfatiglandales bacterium]